MVDVSGQLPEAVTVHPVSSREELEQAFRLVYSSYLQRGYLVADPSEIRLGIHNMLPETATFVGLIRGEVIATVTVVPDSPIGLPMDEVYHDKTQALRDSGRTISEVTMLADRRLEIRRTLPMLMNLMKYATLVLKANDLCITINPRHEAFYRRYLLFADMGEERSYHSVQDNPALAKRLNLDTVWEACSDSRLLQRVFFEERTAVSEFENRYALTCDDLHYFGFELTSVLRNPDPNEMDYLRDTHPSCPWDRWSS